MFTQKELEVLELALKEFSSAFAQNKTPYDTRATIEKFYSNEEIVDFLSIAKNLQDRLYHVIQDRNVLLDGIATLNNRVNEITPEVR